MELRKHEAITNRTDMFKIDPRRLQIEPGFNVRDLEAPSARDALDELKDSIRVHWVQSPLEVRLVGESLYVSHGHRRLKAVMELIDEGHEPTPVPAIAEPKGLSEVDRKARIYTLNANEPLSPLEKAELVRWLLNEGKCSREEVAERIGVKTLAMVDHYLKMSEMPKPIREAVRAGEISATNAVHMVTREGPLIAEQKLEEAKAAATEKAEAKGKTGSARVTAKVLPTPKPRTKKAAVVVLEVPKEKGALAKFDDAMSALGDLVSNHVEPQRAATSCMLSLRLMREIAIWIDDVVKLMEAKVGA